MLFCKQIKQLVLKSLLDSISLSWNGKSLGSTRTSILLDELLNAVVGDIFCLINDISLGVSEL